MVPVNVAPLKTRERVGALLHWGDGRNLIFSSTN